MHSEYSWDSKVPVDAYIQEAEKKEFAAISITDHNSTESHEIIRSLQTDTKVILIPGQEINTLDGHLLIYGWLPTIERDLSMQETITLARNKSDKIYCVAAHPFDTLRGGRGRKVFQANIDGIETLNASALLGIFNSRAKKISGSMDLIKLGNSDSHRLNEFGTAWTEIPTSTDIEQVLQNLILGTAKGNRIGLKRKSIRFLRRKIGRISE